MKPDIVIGKIQKTLRGREKILRGGRAQGVCVINLKTGTRSVCRKKSRQKRAETEQRETWTSSEDVRRVRVWCFLAPSE